MGRGEALPFSRSDRAARRTPGIRAAAEMLNPNFSTASIRMKALGCGGGSLPGSRGVELNPQPGTHPLLLADPGIPVCVYEFRSLSQTENNNTQSLTIRTKVTRCIERPSGTRNPVTRSRNCLRKNRNILIVGRVRQRAIKRGEHIASAPRGFEMDGVVSAQCMFVGHFQDAAAILGVVAPELQYA